MRLIRCILLLLVCLLSKEVNAQLVNGPVVEGRFEQVYLTENFDSVTAAWPVVSNSDNLLLIQNGEMILQRRTASAPFAVIASLQNNLTEFRLITSLKLTKAGEDGSLGLIFMAQPGGKGGFVFEINQHQQYRLRQITGAVYRFMTGDAKTNGWVKNSLVKENGNANIVEVRSANRRYDLLLNNRYLLSFAEMAYRTGSTGYFVGPMSKGAIDFLYIFQGEAAVQSDPAAGNVIKDSLSDQDIVVLTESIIRLKNQVNKLNTENEELRQMIKLQRAENLESKNDISAMRLEITELQVTSAKLRQSNDSIIQANTELTKYKTAVEGQGDGDVLMTLSRSLKSEKQKNEELRKENNMLKEQLQKAKSGVPASN